MPVFSIILGNILNELGDNQSSPTDLTAKVNRIVPYFVYVGLVCLVCAYMQGFFWASAAVRQVNRLRSIYLRKVLRQDIGYFDTTGTSGFLLQGLNEDCISIQQAIGE